MVRQIYNKIPLEQQQQIRDALRETAARLWSWEGVAGGVLAASAGRLDELPSVPGPER